MNVPYTSGGTATTVKVESNGTVLATPAHQSSWVRLARALIDLYLEGEISTEPSCPCDPYREKDCGHPARTENDVRNRLRQILAEDDMM